MDEKRLTINEIDTCYSFTMDSPCFWDDFWEKDYLYGSFNVDPDIASKTLQLYNKLLYSRILPNGEIFNLECGKGSNYLSWRGLRFGSDSITASFRYKKTRPLIVNASNAITDWKSFMTNYIKKTYTIGGEIIFPKYQGGLNQARGCNIYIRDRWDLTLECIRRYYNNEESPLSKVLIDNKSYFDLFVDFQGFVNFFFLQDCVENDTVILWLSNDLFEKNPFPKNANEYLKWIEKQLNFVEKRNARINKFLHLTKK